MMKKKNEIQVGKIIALNGEGNEKKIIKNKNTSL